MTQEPWTVERARQRAGMFVGNVHEPPMTLLDEVLANVVDLHLAGRCTHVDVALADGGRVTVTDRGPGLDADLLAAAADVWRSTPTLDGHRPHVHLGKGGGGLFMLATFCEHFEVDTVRAGERAHGSWRRGVRDGAIERTATDATPGTRMSWLPDGEIYRGSLVLPMTDVLDRLEVLADTLPALEVGLGVSHQSVRRAPRGLRAQLEGQPIIELGETVGEVRVDVALAWRWCPPKEDLPPRVTSFVNYARTPWGGTHARGVLDAVEAVGVELTLERPLLDALDAAVAVVTREVVWGTPTKNRVSSPELRGIVRSVVERGLREALRSRPELLEQLRHAWRG